MNLCLGPADVQRVLCFLQREKVCNDEVSCFDLMTGRSHEKRWVVWYLLSFIKSMTLFPWLKARFTRLYTSLTFCLFLCLFFLLILFHLFLAHHTHYTFFLLKERWLSHSHFCLFAYVHTYHSTCTTETVSKKYKKKINGRKRYVNKQQL